MQISKWFLNGAMVELKLEALFTVPFDQMVNPRNLVTVVGNLSADFGVMIAVRNRYMWVD